MMDVTASCRTCMKDNVNFIDLFEDVKIEENCIQLAELLVLCTPTQVSRDDGLPQKLCDECARVLQLAYSFRNQAAKAEEEFKKLLETSVKFEPLELEPKTENDADYFESFEDFDIIDGFKTVKEEFEKTFLCSKCNKTFLKEKSYLKHMQSHESPLQCTVCYRSYLNQAALKKHMAKHQIGANRTFDTETSLEQQIDDTDNQIEVKIENETQKTLLQCSDCDLTFTKLRSLSMHKRSHRKKEKSNEFICDTCGKAFSIKSQLKRHVLVHSEVRPYSCTKCDKTYARKDALSHHMLTHKDSKKYECSYCKKGFTQLCSLKDHIRSHTGETPFLCSQCGKGFSNSSNLRQHMMRHTGLKPYACNMCPKSFCTKGQMTSHMSTHTGAHPFKCEECGAAFTKQTSLKKHSFIHLGIRPFACDNCNMRFTCKDHLKRHYRIHTGEKPYRCNYCERSFSQSNDLVKHTRAHVGQNIYQCTICSMRFRLSSELRSHYPVHFVDGKLQPPETKEEPQIPIKPPSPTKELEPLLILKPRTDELPLITFKENPLLTIKPLDKELPMLNLKPLSPSYEGITEIRTQDKNRYTITINSCDKNGLVNGITINIPTKDE